MSYNIDTMNDYGNLPFATSDVNADNRGKFVLIGADGQLTVPLADAKAHGVLRAGVTEGFAPAVTMGGFPYVLASEALAYGDEVSVAADGGAKVATAGAVLGVVVSEAAPGEFARIKFNG